MMTITTLVPREVAAILNISTRTLQRLTNEGAISSVRVRKSVRYTPEQLQEFIRSCTNAAR